MMRRLLIAFALLAGCSDPEPPAPAKTVEAPEPEPEAPTPPSDDGASDAMKTALLGGGEEKPAESEEASDPAPEPDPQPKRRQPKARADKDDGQSKSRSKPTPALPEAPARLSDAEFEGVVGDWQGVKRCVTTNRPRGGAVQNGALSVQFTIAGNGVVEAAQVEDTSGAFARTLAPCVERKAMRLRFPDFGGKSSVTRSAKFVF